MSACDASWGGEMKQPPHRLRLSQLWVAVRVGLWLSGLPIRMRVHGPTFPPPPAHPGAGARAMPWSLGDGSGGAARTAHLSTAVLSRAAVPAGVPPAGPGALPHLEPAGLSGRHPFWRPKDGEALRGHSWVTVDGRPVAERRPPKALHTIYSFPAAVSRTSRERSNVDRQS